VLVGGVEGAQKCFLGSNYDWGQDLTELGLWVRKHPGIGPLAVSYYGPIGPEFAGVSDAGLPPSFFQEAQIFADERDAPEGVLYWAISSNFLNGLPGTFHVAGVAGVSGKLRSSLLTPRRAFARVGSTIFLFRIGPGSGPGTLNRGLLRGCILPTDGDEPVGTP
jgi:hypothetical protein